MPAPAAFFFWGGGRRAGRAAGYESPVCAAGGGERRLRCRGPATAPENPILTLSWDRPRLFLPAGRAWRGWDTHSPAGGAAGPKGCWSPGERSPRPGCGGDVEDEPPPWWVLKHPGASLQETSPARRFRNKTHLRRAHPRVPDRHQIPVGAPCLANTPAPGPTPHETTAATTPTVTSFGPGTSSARPSGLPRCHPLGGDPAGCVPGRAGGSEHPSLAGSRGGEAGAGRAAGPKPPDGNIWFPTRCGFRALAPSGLPCFVRGRAGRPPRPLRAAPGGHGAAGGPAGSREPSPKALGCGCSAGRIAVLLRALLRAGTEPGGLGDAGHEEGDGAPSEAGPIPLHTTGWLGATAPSHFPQQTGTAPKRWENWALALPNLVCPPPAGLSPPSLCHCSGAGPVPLGAGGHKCPREMPVAFCPRVPWG